LILYEKYSDEKYPFSVRKTQIDESDRTEFQHRSIRPN